MTPRIWMELSFNVAYLITIWAIVGVMIWRDRQLPASQHRLRTLFIWAFGLLALGDTGHVGFRVLAYGAGDLSTVVSLWGRSLGLVGLGALATAITLTLFYGILQLICHERFHPHWSWLDTIVVVAVLVRLGLLAFPQNQWNSVIPPQPWSLYRNLPLMVEGLAVAGLMETQATRNGDRPFRWMAHCILISYAFYLPVVFWVQTIPALGMLMIPKTLAYVAIALIALKTTFHLSYQHQQ